MLLMFYWEGWTEEEIAPRIGHQPTSRQQSETEGSPKTEGPAERAIVRALSIVMMEG